MKESEGKNRHTLPLSISTETQRDFQAAATQELQRCKKTRRGRHDLSQHNLARDKLMTLSIADLRRRRTVQLTCSLLSIDTQRAWLPDGYSRIFKIVCVWPFGLLDYGSATLRCKI